MRILIISYLAANPLTPRGARTQAVAAALAERGDVHVVGGPRAETRRTWWHRARDRALSEVGTRWLIDPCEPWSWKALRRFGSDFDVALLIGYPFSPLVTAARTIRRRGIPYVVDMSDPWALTRTSGSADTTWRQRRSASLEATLWAGAAAGIVTTAGQARTLKRLMPDLELMVRPNGYSDVGRVEIGPRAPAKHELRIGHFGNLYAPRIDIGGFLARLVDSGRWIRVTVHQYGSIDAGTLDRLPQGVVLRSYEPVPWTEVVRRAANSIDLALVVGNSDPTQLPSKAIEYLTLPVPRLAVTAGHRGDALAEYVTGKPGWLTVSTDDADPAAQIWRHVHASHFQRFEPPRRESWECVAEQLAAFVVRQTTNTARRR